jgi:hypothetical protein
MTNAARGAALSATTERTGHPICSPTAPLPAREIRPHVDQGASDRAVRAVAMKFGLSFSLAGTICCLAGVGGDGATEAR